MKKIYFGYGYNIISEEKLYGYEECSNLKKEFPVLSLKTDENLVYNNYVYKYDKPVTFKKENNICIVWPKIGNCKIDIDNLAVKLFILKTIPKIFYSIVLYQIIGKIASYNNNISLHCTCLGLNDKNYIIMGHSGAGKSTLTATLLEKFDYEYISEELTVCKIIDNHLCALKGIELIRLYDDSVKILKKQNYRFFIDDSRKKCIWKNEWNGKRDIYNNVRALIFLEKNNSGRVGINRLNSNEAFVKLIQNIYSNPLKDSDKFTPQLLEVKKMSEAIPCYVYGYNYFPNENDLNNWMMVDFDLKKV